MGEYENGTYIPDALELSDLKAAGRVPARPIPEEPECWACYPFACDCWTEDYTEHEERTEYKHDEH